MLLALGAASAALDAFQSLTAPQPSSSQPIGFGPNSDDPFDISAPATEASTPASGFIGGPQISSDTIGALLDAQSQSSTNSPVQFGDSGFSNADPLSPASSTSSSAASSAYNSIDQLIQRQQENAIPPAFNPLSINV
jgi:hypothetical protein